MSTERSPASSGSWTGAFVGAVTRPMVVSAFWLFQQNRAETWLAILITSCLFGLLVGWITGSIAASRSSLRHPWVGPLIGGLFGAMLSFASSVVTLFFLCLATYQPRAAEVNIRFYWAVMTLVGALPGICGGLAANRARQSLADRIAEVELRPAEGPLHPEE
jgi:hypothetical protein